MMNTSLTINIPEVALFNKEYLKQLVTTFVKTLAANPDNPVFAKTADKEVATQKLKINWREMSIPQEVADMTFQNRVDLGTSDYKNIPVLMPEDFLNTITE